MISDPLQTTARFLREQHLQGVPVLAGFSGGADSTALLLTLHLLGQPLTAVHFQHGLRGKKATLEEAWCRGFCAERGIPFLSRSLQVPHRKRSGEAVEEAARRLRLQAWQELSENGHIPVFLAHHADDCMEDLFLRLARGANSSGLTGLRKIRRIGTVLLFRPFLTLRKTELEEFLRSRGIMSWCLDDSNQDNGFRRNAVRNLMLPEFRRIFGTDAGLLQARETLLQDAEFLEELAARELPGLRSRSAWRALPAALLPRVLRLWMKQEFAADNAPSASLCRRLQNALQKKSSAGEIIPVSSELCLFLDENGLRRFEKAPADSTVHLWNWPSEPCLILRDIGVFFLAGPDGRKVPPPGKILAEERFNREEFPDELQVRFWQPGDRMIPFGSNFHKKLQDLFTDAHIARDQRACIPLLLAGTEIIWVPGVRRAEFARTRDGKSAIAISCGILSAQSQ